MSSPEDEDYKLPLRHWLKNQVDSGKYPGLEWKGRNCIKIPWIQQHHPDWEPSYQIFVAWAKHKNNFNPNEPPNYKKLKGNFRCALKKSTDFEELKSQNDLQTGNYRLYRLCDREEVEEKKEEQKKKKRRLKNIFSPGNGKRSRSSEHSTDNQQVDSEYCESNFGNNAIDPVNLNTLNSVYSPAPSVINEMNFKPPDCLQSNEQQINLQTLNSCSLGSEYEQKHSNNSEKGGSFQKVFQSLTQAVEVYERSRITDHSVATSPMVDTMSPADPTNFYNNLPPRSPQDQKLIRIMEILDKYRLSSQSLPIFTMTLYYVEKHELEERILEERCDLTINGVLAFSANQQEEILMQNKKKELASCSRFKLPTSRSRVINNILDNFKQGLVFHFDNNEGVLYCTRHARIGAFFCGADKAVELKRRVPVPVFDYLEKLEKFDRRKNKMKAAELVIGTKPHLEKRIKIKVTADLAHQLVQPPPSYSSITSTGDMPSVCLDNADSLDQQLEKLKL